MIWSDFFEKRKKFIIYGVKEHIDWLQRMNLELRQ